MNEDEITSARALLFQDNPLLAAKRKAFDNPTQDNLDALIQVARSDLKQERDNAALAHQSAQFLADELAEALKALHDDIAEYAKINNLGGFDNHCMKQARAVIAKAEGKP